MKEGNAMTRVPQSTPKDMLGVLPPITPDTEQEVHAGVTAENKS